MAAVGGERRPQQALVLGEYLVVPIAQLLHRRVEPSMSVKRNVTRSSDAQARSSSQPSWELAVSWPQQAATARRLPGGGESRVRGLRLAQRRHQVVLDGVEEDVRADRAAVEERLESSGRDDEEERALARH